MDDFFAKTLSPTSLETHKICDFAGTPNNLAACQPYGPLSPLAERHSEPRQQTPSLVVRLRGRNDRNLEPAQLVDLVVVDLRKDHLLAQAKRVVPATVEGIGADPAKVADARQRDVQQLVEEIPHAAAAQSRLDADGLAGAQLERGDRLLGLDELWLLAGDRLHVTYGRVERLVVVLRLADADVDHDLVDARHLHGVPVVELLGQLLGHRCAVRLKQARRRLRPGAGRLRGLLLLRLLLGLSHHCASVLRTRSYGSPQWRQTSTRAPDSRMVCLVRVGLPQD